MRIALGRLTLHESVFFATREIGRLYETERYLHNYALTYALGLAQAPYFHVQQTPAYREQLEPLNTQGIYVTPAKPIAVEYALNTFKYASNLYHVETPRMQRNTPTYGRLKELAVNSRFEFAVLMKYDAQNHHWPEWIRLGLWLGKAKLDLSPWMEARSTPVRLQQAAFPLNPLDLPAESAARITLFDLISMPPVSLLDRAEMESEGWEITVDGQHLWLPAGLAYRFGPKT